MILRRTLRVVLAIVCLGFYMPPPTPVAAYYAGPRLQPEVFAPTVQYSIDPNLG